MTRIMVLTRPMLCLVGATLLFLGVTRQAYSAYIDEVLADNPIGYWQFEEQSGPAADSSGNSRDGTYMNGVTPGLFPGALTIGGTSAAFDGATGFVDLPGAWGGPAMTELTLEAWVNPSDPVTGDFQAIVSGHDPNDFAHFQLHSTGNSGVYTDVGFVPTPIAPATPTGVRRHVVMTAKTGETNVYVDGAQIGATVTTPFTNVTESSNVDIGIGHLGTRWFSGLLDEVAFYDTALSQQRVIDHFVAGGGTPPVLTPASLLAHWPFDSDASDVTGNHNGTFEGGVTITSDARTGSGALELRGINGYVDIPSTVLDLEESASISFFVSLDSVSHGCCHGVFTNNGWDPGKVHVNISTASEAAQWAINSGSSGTMTNVIPTDGSTWAHMAFVYDSSTGVTTPYFNGTPETTFAGPIGRTVGIGPSTIGSWNGTDRFLDGRIDDLRVYSGLLTPEQVIELAGVPGPPPPASLLAHWTFDNDGSDATGNHDGTLEGGASITGDAQVGGGALDLRAVNGYVDVPTAALDGESSFSVAMFVSVDSLTHACCSGLLTNDSWAPGKLHVNVATATEVPEAAVNGNPTSAWGLDAPIATDGSWVHLAFTYDGESGTMTPYINGVAGNAGTGGTALSIGDGPLNIGAWDTSGGNTQDRFLDGRIDDLRIYSGVLTPEQVGQLAVIPEPSAFALAALALAGLYSVGRRQQRMA